MKKILNLILVTVLLQCTLAAQDFAVTNPTMNPNPGIFPGGTETVTFNFSVSQNYTFSSNPASNNYAYITFSFTKLNPTSTGPSGTGASLFNWTLTNNGGTGVNLAYTWTGTTKDITMSNVPNSYVILFTNVPITFGATQAETDIRVAGQFTDPGNAPTGLAGNNNAVIATYTAAGGPLPIRLLSFNGIKEETKVQLKWATTSEQNSKLFDVEFSVDGVSWKSIGSLVLNADGTYTFTPVNGFTGPVSFVYTTCDNGVPQACASATLYIMVTPPAATPDLTPRINLNPNNVIGTSRVEVTVQVNELNNVPTNGSTITLYVDKLTSFSNFSFNSAQTTNQAGQPVQNSQFTIDATSNPNYYIIRTNAVFQNSGIRVTFYVTETPGQTKGSTPVNVYLENGSGGETNFTNNTSFTILTFSF